MATDIKLRPPEVAATMHQRPWAETFTSYERELAELRQTATALREVLACEEALLHQKDEMIRQLELLGKESDHRFLNSVQMIASLLSMQARTASNPQTASELGVAADRVIMIAAIHRRLHSLASADTAAVAFKPYLQELCRDFSRMLGGNGSDATIFIDAIDAELPGATAVPLSLIVSELITNAAKYGNGQIMVQLAANGCDGYALTVANGGPGLPIGFDARSKGLGMTIIRSLVAKIRGELRFGPGDHGQGARFTVLFG